MVTNEITVSIREYNESIRNVMKLQMIENLLLQDKSNCVLIHKDKVAHIFGWEGETEDDLPFTNED